MGKSEDQGINYLAAKVSEITGQSINHYLVVDFRGFQKIVDVLGGVEVDVPHDLIDRMYPVDGQDRYTTLIIRMGLQHFDGSTALKYARSRHSTSDFDRSERQQAIIKAIKEKALSAGFLTNP
jgi:polyisoprenyl-teichoic acid--peptidoglycan teichoic acid transferase